MTSDRGPTDRGPTDRGPADRGPTERLPIDREAVPPGQSMTRKFPVVGEKAPPPEALDLDAWRLEITGLVDRSQVLTYPEVRSKAPARRRVDIHCVTGWSRLATTFDGLPLRALLDAARPRPSARFVRFEAYSERAHDTSVDLETALRDGWLVWAADGRDLEPRHGWPLRVLLPSRYFYKSLKWVRRIELLAEDRDGFWERTSAYHPVGDPWPGDQRFTSGSIEPDRLERLRSAESLSRWRGKVVLGADLRGWRPADRDLRRLMLKSCDLRRAELEVVDLRQANLSLSDLRGADLRGADLRDADLEGASFVGADLRGADLRGSALSATTFLDTDGDLEARVDGMRWHGAHGLLEAQEDFLRRFADGAA
ncbi:MAG: molybdopterin-dependent oxidoreductase [Acidobacteriota bacterium]